VEAAHEQSIIHRDLKPANVKITPEGKVKVLDFGLGKAFGEAPPEAPSDGSQSPTRTLGATAAGTIMGTAAYMSPEQARGKPADRRSDIFSFGCVLYEILTGARAFPGESITEILAGVLRGEPDWNRLPADTPPLIQSPVGRCLQKDPRRRVQHIADCRIEVEEALSEPLPVSAPVIPVKRAGRSALAAWLLAAVFAVAVPVVSWLAWNRALAAGSCNLYMVPPEGTSFYLDAPSGMNAISPDGRTLAFIVTS
jgi:serine/threonine protein kinase